ncbi:MAG: type II toxin-antitoxin system VapC family toxin [Thermodesulfobacteriota bacterium]|nr:type II toxin-antitoxin system VapC family toxin [Thermodesulfobacteriota bacterium]
MKYLLDTDTCIHYLNNPNSSVRRHLERLQPMDVVLCSMVKAELYYGAYKSEQTAKNLDALELLFNTLTSLPFDDFAARIYGEIRSDLSTKGMVIGPNDLIIAAITLAHNLTLVTHNTDEFLRVVNLKVEDWKAKE